LTKPTKQLRNPKDPDRDRNAHTHTSDVHKNNIHKNTKKHATAKEHQATEHAYAATRIHGTTPLKLRQQATPPAYKALT
jgi:hypothetical protein